MTFRGDEITFSGNREKIERELSKSVAQILHLVPGRLPGNRFPQEVGVDLVLSVAFVRAGPSFAADIAADIAACTRASTTPPDPRRRAEDNPATTARAEAEVTAGNAVRDHLNTADG